MKVTSAVNERNKIVYVLGAGFSKGAGAPSQEQLVGKIFKIASQGPNEYQSDAVKKFKNFLEESLCIPEAIHESIPLEDIFTPLDKCASDNISFRNLNVNQAAEIRSIVYYLIGKTMEILLRNSEKGYIDTFSDYLIERSLKRANHNYDKVDSVSVITTNWDILLDNSIQSKIDDKYSGKAVVDYCCHISSYLKEDERVKPGLEILGRGGFNVKLLKVHGSLNWLQCPRCLRVYVDLYDKITITQYTEQGTCRHCDKNFSKHDSHILTSNLIMPTFLKNLLNPQYKIIWQNAGIELSEADKIVFIGYSLPYADFEMRQLLSRMVRPNAEIEVVDKGEETEESIKSTMKRYSIFFGDRKMSFSLNGAQDYIAQLK